MHVVLTAVPHADLGHRKLFGCEHVTLGDIGCRDKNVLARGHHRECQAPDESAT